MGHAARCSGASTCRRATWCPPPIPVAVTVNRSGSRAFVALWNGSAVAELDLNDGKVLRSWRFLLRGKRLRPVPIRLRLPGARTRRRFMWRWPTVMRWPRARGWRRAASSRLSTTRGLPGQTYFGAMPDAVAVSKDGKRLFAANTGSDAIAVFDLGGRQAAGGKAIPRSGLGADRVVSNRAGGCG
jgi:hypothetical protein